MLQHFSTRFSENFPNKKSVIGVIHLPALLGSPLYDGNLKKIYEQALQEADILNRHTDGIIIENFGDKPFFPNSVPAETIATMAAIGREVVRQTDVPIGINVLRNDAEAALAIATAIEAHFIRVNIHTHAVVADQGIIQGMAYKTLRLRKALGSKVLIFADVSVKHANPLTQKDLAVETQDLSERGLADAIIVSGTRTGETTNANDLDIVKQNTDLPILIGSGTTPDNLDTLSAANGFIVGSYFKENGKVTKPIVEKRVKYLVEKVRMF